MREEKLCEWEENWAAGVDGFQKSNHELFKYIFVLYYHESFKYIFRFYFYYVCSILFLFLFCVQLNLYFYHILVNDLITCYTARRKKDRKTCTVKF